MRAQTIHVVSQDDVGFGIRYMDLERRRMRLRTESTESGSAPSSSAKIVHGAWLARCARMQTLAPPDVMRMGRGKASWYSTGNEGRLAK